jgi:hypothetical protein
MIFMMIGWRIDDWWRLLFLFFLWCITRVQRWCQSMMDRSKDSMMLCFVIFDLWLHSFLFYYYLVCWYLYTAFYYSSLIILLLLWKWIGRMEPATFDSSLFLIHEDSSSPGNIYGKRLIFTSTINNNCNCLTIVFHSKKSRSDRSIMDSFRQIKSTPRALRSKNNTATTPTRNLNNKIIIIIVTTHAKNFRGHPTTKLPTNYKAHASSNFLLCSTLYYT